MSRHQTTRRFSDFTGIEGLLVLAAAVPLIALLPIYRPADLGAFAQLAGATVLFVLGCVLVDHRRDIRLLQQHQSPGAIHGSHQPTSKEEQT